jgi:hypothetical protein
VIATLKGRQREILVVVLLACVLWLRQMMVGEMTDEIAKLASPTGVPAKRNMLAKVRQAEKDAVDFASRMDAIRRQPIQGLSLPAMLERFHQGRGIQPVRMRLVPRPSVRQENNLMEESVDVSVSQMALDEVTDYLAQLEQQGPSLRVRSLKMNKVGDTANLSLVVSALRPQ